MANAARAIIETLHDTAAVTALIGSGNSFRCYPGRILQGDAMPAIRWHLNETTPERHLTGTAGYAYSGLTLDCIGDTYDDALELAEACVDALDEASADKGGVAVHFIQAEIQAHGFFREPGALDSQDRHMIAVDVAIYHGN